MKVTFTCEKCGWFVFETLAEHGENVDVPPGRCPACDPPQITYGPLTEEMMAEALWEAAGEDFTWTKGMREHLKAETRSRARFVLRLLKATRWPNVASSPELWADDCLTDWRDWLLDLAREDAK